jgi:hypothetical protein
VRQCIAYPYAISYEIFLMDQNLVGSIYSEPFTWIFCIIILSFMCISDEDRGWIGNWIY